MEKKLNFIAEIKLDLIGINIPQNLAKSNVQAEERPSFIININ
jgi:hypothetical protein